MIFVLLTKFSINSSDKFVDNSAEILVFLHVFSAGDGHLDQDDLTNPLWVLSQEDLQGVQLLRYTLDVIQTINSNDKLDTFKLLLEGVNSVNDLWLLQAFHKLIRVDSNRERGHRHVFSTILDSIGRSSHLQYPRTTAEEMSGVVIRMEADQVTLQHAHKQLLSHGQNSVYLARRERGVQEESNLDILPGVADLLAQHLGEEHEMVVVDPDHVAVLHVFGHGLGEEAVHLLVC